MKKYKASEAIIQFTSSINEQGLDEIAELKNGNACCIS